MTIAKPSSLHSVLMLLALRGLYRLALLVHDAGARVDEISTIGAAELIDAITASPELCVPTFEALGCADPAAHDEACAVLACPFAFDRVVDGEAQRTSVGRRRPPASALGARVGLEVRLERPGGGARAVPVRPVPDSRLALRLGGDPVFAVERVVNLLEGLDHRGALAGVAAP